MPKKKTPTSKRQLEEIDEEKETETDEKAVENAGVSLTQATENKEQTKEAGEEDPSQLVELNIVLPLALAQALEETAKEHGYGDMGEVMVDASRRFIGLS